ncbi:MAG: carboxypeptidase-like regulatory domain-containing protein [Chitinophagaceae bacterium]|nr:carboxypeptidase-like regulatory domain-containing protein [Chitinophagaceae bacterium]
MSKKLQLSIAEPCHENWDSMTPSQKGKFCGFCQKQVVDFTHMSDRQVIEFFKKPSTGSVCGRFITDQLDREMDIPKKRMPWLKYFFSIALPAFFISKLSAQHKMGMVAKPMPVDTARVNVVPETRMLGEVAPSYLPVNCKPDLDLTDKVTGKVVNENGEVVPFASIETGKKGEGIMTDENGQFTINKIWLKKGRSLTVSSAGYETKIILAGEEEYAAGKIVVALKANVVLPEVVITALGNVRQGFITVGMVMTKGETIVKLTDSTLQKPGPKTNLPMEPAFHLYPNPVPAGGTVNMSFTKLEEGYYQLQIISLTGQLMQQKEIWIDTEARLLNLELPALAASTYFIVMTDKRNGKKFSEKIIIQ